MRKYILLNWSNGVLFRACFGLKSKPKCHNHFHLITHFKAIIWIKRTRLWISEAELGFCGRGVLNLGHDSILPMSVKQNLAAINDWYKWKWCGSPTYSRRFSTVWIVAVRLPPSLTRIANQNALMLLLFPSNRTFLGHHRSYENRAINSWSWNELLCKSFYFSFGMYFTASVWVLAKAAPIPKKPKGVVTCEINAFLLANSVD